MDICVSRKLVTQIAALFQLLPFQNLQCDKAFRVGSLEELYSHFFAGIFFDAPFQLLQQQYASQGFV